MTSRERVCAVLRNEIPDKIPKDLSWGLCPAKIKEFEKKTGRTDYEDYFGLDVRVASFGPTKLQKDFSHFYHGRDSERGFSIDEWGVGSSRSQDESLHFTHMISPLKNGMSERDAADYPLPDLLSEYRHHDLAEKVGAVHSKNLAAAGNIAQTLFETSWAIRGFEETLMDMVSEPGAIGILFDRITDMRIEQAKLFVQAGVDVLMLGDDVGMQTGMLMSTEVWCDMLKPRLARVIEAARSARHGIPIFYHSCGNLTPVIPHLVEIGVTVLNPIQPECIDHRWVKSTFGHQLSFWGGVSAQTNMSFGTPADVREEVRRCITLLGENGGYLIGPNHVVEPEVPWENIIAYLDAVEEFGYY